MNAQLTFDLDSQGMPTEVTVHQNGRDQVARRLTDAEVQKAQEALDARRPRSPNGSKNRRDARNGRCAPPLDELQKGEPKYDRTTDDFASLTRQQLPQLKELLNGFGAPQSMTLEGVGQGGWDIYETVFEKHKMEFRIVLTPDGKLPASAVDSCCSG